MKRVSHQLINVPLDFKVACAIYKLDIQEVLQIFIDHITLYDSICREYNEGFLRPQGRFQSMYWRRKQNLGKVKLF